MENTSLWRYGRVLTKWPTDDKSWCLQGFVTLKPGVTEQDAAQRWASENGWSLTQVKVEVIDR